MKITQPHPDPLLEQLRLFNQAAQPLTRQWSLTEDDANHPIVMADKYPFDESFDKWPTKFTNSMKLLSTINPPTTKAY